MIDQLEREGEGCSILNKLHFFVILHPVQEIDRSLLIEAESARKVRKSMSVLSGLKSSGVDTTNGCSVGKFSVSQFIGFGHLLYLL